jgi:hypothetical protein
MAGVKMLQDRTLGACAQVVKEIKDTRSNFEELAFYHEGDRTARLITLREVQF